jgi:hypothetical protein
MDGKRQLELVENISYSKQGKMVYNISAVYASPPGESLP